MRVLVTLLRKDLQRLSLLLPFLILLTIISVTISSIMLARSESILSYFVITTLFASPILPIIGLVLGHHLIVQEYYSHTHRYLEALPIKRLHLASAKYLLGLSILMSIGLLVWCYSHWMASQREVIGAVYSLTMLVKLSVYIFTLWNLVFLFSFLGRFRIPLLFLSYLLLQFLDEFTSFELGRFGPIALVDSELFSEQGPLPLVNIGQSLLIAFVALFFTGLLVNHKDGSLTEKLAVPMSWPERTFLLVLAAAGLLIYNNGNQQINETEPYLGENYLAQQGPIEIAYLEPSYEADAAMIMSQLQPMVESLDQLLAHDEGQFKVRISLSPASLAKDYHTSASSRRYGVLISANFKQTRVWPRDFFAAFVIHEYLIALTSSRASIEPNHWMMDGFSYWWALRYQNDRRQETLDPAMLLAIYATRRIEANALSLRNWDQTAEALGDNLNMALAYSAWRVLELSAGYDVAARLGQREFSRQPKLDARDWFFELGNPQQQRFEAATGISYPTFIKTWQDELSRLAQLPAYQDGLAKLPDGEFLITTEASGDGFRDVVFEYASNKPMSGHTECEIQHAILPHYDPPYYGLDISNEDVSPQYGMRRLRHTIDANYSLGARVYGALDCKFEGFELPLRLGSLRVILK